MFNPVIVWLLVILSNSHLISDCYSFCTPNVLGRCAPLSYDISKKSIHHSTYQQYLTRVRSIDSSKDIFSLSESGSETSIDVDGDNEYKQNLVKTLQWVLASLGFAGILGVTKGLTTSVEFVSGYVLEQSLSIDNLFVFIVLFDYFKIPVQRQDRILSYGLNVAIILRGLFISIGFVAINKYKQVLLIFAALLLFSSYKILFSVDDGDDEEDLASNKIVQFAQTFFKTTTEFEGDKFFIEKDNVKLATPLFICLICVELSDVLFALDSVPAVFGVTQDPLVVFTSNIFAIASLRAVYGVLSKAVSELEYLEKAVGAILGVVAIKMSFESFDMEILSPLQSLFLVLSILFSGVALSLIKRNMISNMA